MQLDGNTPIVLNLTLETTNVVLGALSALPYERVAGLITAIQQQAAPQVVAAQTPAPAAPVDVKTPAAAE
jgi:hypothetical protein